MNKSDKSKNGKKSKKEVERLINYYNLIKNDDTTNLFKTPTDVLSILRFTDVRSLN